MNKGDVRIGLLLLPHHLLPGYSDKVLEVVATYDDNRINYSLVAALVSQILTQYTRGGVLVFMPGEYEINKTIDAIKQKCFGEAPEAWLCFFCFSHICSHIPYVLIHLFLQVNSGTAKTCG